MKRVHLDNCFPKTKTRMVTPIMQANAINHHIRGFPPVDATNIRCVKVLTGFDFTCFSLKARSAFADALRTDSSIFASDNTPSNISRFINGHVCTLMDAFVIVEYPSHLDSA